MTDDLAPCACEGNHCEGSCGEAVKEAAASVRPDHSFARAAPTANGHRDIGLTLRLSNKPSRDPRSSGVSLNSHVWAAEALPARNASRQRPLLVELPTTREVAPDKPPTHIDADVRGVLPDADSLIMLKTRPQAASKQIDDACTLDGTCLAEWKFKYLVRAGIVKPNDAHVKDEIERLLQSTSKRPLDVPTQLRRLIHYQESLGLFPVCYAGRGTGTRRLRWSWRAFLRNPKDPGSYYPSTCPCCDLADIVDSHTVVLGGVTNGHARPLELLSVVCPPCFGPCQIHFIDTVTGEETLAQLVMNGDHIGSIGEEIPGEGWSEIFELNAVIVEPPLP